MGACQVNGGVAFDVLYEWICVVAQQQGDDVIVFVGDCFVKSGAAVVLFILEGEGAASLQQKLGDLIVSSRAGENEGGAAICVLHVEGCGSVDSIVRGIPFQLV